MIEWSGHCERKNRDFDRENGGHEEQKVSDDIYTDMKNKSGQTICKIHHDSLYKNIIMANCSIESQSIKVLEASQLEYQKSANQKL